MRCDRTLAAPGFSRSTLMVFFVVQAFSGSDSSSSLFRCSRYAISLAMWLSTALAMGKT